jgi:ankyrin repeat protein
MVNDYGAQLRVIDNSVIMAAATGNSREFYRLLGMDGVVDATDMDGNTALHHLAARGYSSMATHLVDIRRAIINKRNKNDMSPLDLAAKAGCIRMVDLLAIRYPESEASSTEFRRAAGFARANNHLKIADLLEKMAVKRQPRKAAPEIALTVSLT